VEGPEEVDDPNVAPLGAQRWSGATEALVNHQARR